MQRLERIIEVLSYPSAHSRIQKATPSTKAAPELYTVPPSSFRSLSSRKAASSFPLAMAASPRFPIEYSVLLSKIAFRHRISYFSRDLVSFDAHRRPETSPASDEPGARSKAYRKRSLGQGRILTNVFHKISAWGLDSADIQFPFRSLISCRW